MRMVDRFTTLSERERVVLQHLQDGRSACEIAALEYRTIATVRSQIRSVLLKLGVKNQLQAVAMANARTQQVRCDTCAYRLERTA